MNTTQVPTYSPTSESSTSSSSTARGGWRVQMKESLRGKTYDEQTTMLDPGAGAAPVQMYAAGGVDVDQQAAKEEERRATSETEVAAEEERKAQKDPNGAATLVTELRGWLEENHERFGTAWDTYADAIVTGFDDFLSFSNELGIDSLGDDQGDDWWANLDLAAVGIVTSGIGKLGPVGKVASVGLKIAAGSVKKQRAKLSKDLDDQIEAEIQTGINALEEAGATDILGVILSTIRSAFLDAYGPLAKVEACIDVLSGFGTDAAVADTVGEVESMGRLADSYKAAYNSAIVAAEAEAAAFPATIELACATVQGAFWGANLEILAGTGATVHANVYYDAATKEFRPITDVPLYEAKPMIDFVEGDEMRKLAKRILGRLDFYTGTKLLDLPIEIIVQPFDVSPYYDGPERYVSMGADKQYVVLNGEVIRGQEPDMSWMDG